MKPVSLAGLIRRATGQTGLEANTSFRPRALSAPKTPPPIPETKSGQGGTLSEANYQEILNWILEHYGITDGEVRGWIAIGKNPPGGGGG